jgi:protein-S-isoprenylcysteine O-methyltransferase Ste14
MAAILLALPPAPAPGWVPLIGLCLVAAGEALRLWGVRHIGVISRTRGERLGPLVMSGPFRFVRNPLYLGNVALWVGFALCARLAWLSPIVLLVLAAEYRAIVAWEERLLASRLGAPYLEYLRRVPRWLPSWRRPDGSVDAVVAYSWRDTIYSERGTLVAIAVGYSLLVLKHQFATGAAAP